MRLFPIYGQSLKPKRLISTLCLVGAATPDMRVHPLVDVHPWWLGEATEVHHAFVQVGDQALSNDVDADERLHQRYENGVLIVETGDMVTFAVPAVVPELTAALIIEGVEWAISNLTPIPVAGTTIAWKAWYAV